MSTDQINQIINTLAAKLGPLGKTVWEAYVRQQLVIGFQELAWGVLLLVVAIICAVVIRKTFKDSKDSDLDDGDATIIILASIFGLVCLGVSLGLTFDAVGHLANPQYGAVQGLLGRP